MTESVNILVVDDHADIRELIKRFLDQHCFNTFTACDGDEMRAILKNNHIDLIVLDLMLPKEDGLSICRKLRENGNNVPIIMLTAMIGETDKIIGLELGADDYLTKPFNPRELLARIKAVLRRSDNIQKTETQKTLKHYFFDQWTLDVLKRELIDPNKTIISLSTAEYELLITFLQHPHETLSRDQLLDQARGREAQVFDRSIDTLISRLRKKLKTENDNCNEIIKTVWGGGYCFIAEVTNDQEQ
ncbi:two-component system, OmpR family, response regulator [Ruminobacter amylophilus]|jgi:two-component system OmpR family response regulator|uniref:Two-component system, OmpR family, response regulator n=1 Tax=Ruminobacter amylophilus TaxID=867 RepID=A0A662ZL43_9GAMM|nr:response regulator [Ruminobacter amylophilus]SFP71537.1 two-component system, OmpR family, response regulator [Ruminobacter amylophilus]